jgi:CRISPR type I-E-associated protein CasB/Cse2
MTVAVREATETAADPLARERAFVDDVAALYENDKGKLAGLRRAAGGTLDEARDISWFFRLLTRHARGRNEVEQRQDEYRLFLIASLLAHDRRALEKRAHFTGNFGRTLAVLKLKPGVSPEAVERRFRILLDARLEPNGGGDLPFRLRQMVKLALSHQAAIDWPQLLADLRDWNHPFRPKKVQKEWARGFYDGANPSGSDTSSNDPAA